MSRLSKIGAACLAAFGWTGGSTVSASYLMVAGGGSGGYGGAGGGGAGGLLSGTTTLNPTLSYTIIVGAGGAPASSGGGINGANTTFNTLTAIGGGGGAGAGPTAAASGGSGGGGNFGITTGGAGTSGQGNAGGTGPSNGSAAGYSNAGGGGAGTVGGSVSGTVAGNGGAGVSSTISGTSVYYAGGGGGSTNTGTAGTGGNGGGGNGATYTVTNPTNGAANLGGGGGGATGGGVVSGAGGSGVVIVSYLAPQKFGGGVVTTDGTNIIHTFNTSGTLAPLNSLTASYLIVAGGGSGAAAGNAGGSGGGGGAGGLLTGSGLTIDTNSTYLVTVGAGGASVTNNGSTGGNQGSNSSFALVSTAAVGGGAGGRGGGASGAGGTGGSGGGAGSATASGGSATSGQGYAGGSTSGSNGPNYGCAGGGGAGGVGSNGTSTTGGNGGVGLASSISGTSIYYAGGGGGGVADGGTTGTGGNGGGGNGGTSGAGAGSSGTANTGGGGGGASTSNPYPTYVSGAGGSGIVIISYPGSTQQMAGGTVTIVGGNVIHTFTSSGYLSPLKFVGNSLRFRQSNNAYLTKPQIAGNSQKWTWSGWVKRGALTTANFQNLFGTIVYPTPSNYQSLIYFTTADKLEIFNYTGGTYDTQLTTTAVYRDPAAWYHVVVAYDTTQAVSTDRVKLYVNGSQVTSFTNTTYPSQNYNTYINNAASSTVALGGTAPYVAGYFDGEMAEVRFIDGQQLAPTAFGTFNQYGVWQPIYYGGSYGTNGFYLPFNPGTSAYAGSYTGSNYIYAPDNSAWAFSGNFTLEAFFYVTTTSPALQNVIGQWVDSGGTDRATQFGVNSAGQLTGSVGTSASVYTITGGTVKTNTWNHGALVLNGTTLTAYLNGVSVGSTTISGTINNSTAGMGVGAYANGSWPVTGNISNARITNTAVYTANFTPPTANLTAISGTQLLTLQNATIVDNSTNAFTLTNVGSLTTGQTYPFAINVFNDQGPAGNNWTPNNISGAAGSNLDYMTDVPTLTSATASNYCVMNPLAYYGSSSPTYSDGNLKVQTLTSTTTLAFGSVAFPFTGKWYYEFSPTASSNSEYAFYSGIASYNLSGSCIYYNNSGGGIGQVYVNGSANGQTGAGYNIGDWIGVAVDADAGTVKFYKNGSLQVTVTFSVTSAYFFAAMADGSSSSNCTYAINFGQQPWNYAPPSGYIPLNTYNL